MKLSWPHVVLYAVAIGVVGALAWQRVDTTAIVGLIIALLAGGTLATVNQVKDQTNGNNQKLMDMITEQGRVIAASYPAPTPPAAPTPPVYDAERTEVSAPSTSAQTPPFAS